MLDAYQYKLAHLRGKEPEPAAKATALALLLTGLGYPETWRPENMHAAAGTHGAAGWRWGGRARGGHAAGSGSSINELTCKNE